MFIVICTHVYGVLPMLHLHDLSVVAILLLLILTLQR